MRISVLGTLCLGLAACGGSSSNAQDEDDTPLVIQLVGDSILAWNADTDEGIAAGLRDVLMANVTDNSVSGARINLDDPDRAAQGFDIPAQFEDGDWDWVVMNGGANDLEEDCGCNACDVVLDAIISADGASGTLPEFITGLTGEGVNVAYLGYFRAGIEDTDSAQCVDEFDELEARVSRLADSDSGLVFVEARDVLSVNELDPDGIHPDPDGSFMLARTLQDAIEAAR